MRKRILLLLAAAGLAGLGLTLPAKAAPALPGIDRAVSALSSIEDAAYVYRGRRYCFYNNGWNGPGWYWCGSAYRRGYGWGGYRGWQGWVWGPAPPPPPMHHRRYWSHGHWHYY